MDGSRACDVGYIVDIVLEDVGVTGHQRVGAGTLKCCVEFREVRIAAAGVCATCVFRMADEGYYKLAPGPLECSRQPGTLALIDGAANSCIDRD